MLCTNRQSQHPLAARQTITAEEIERAEFIWPPRTSPYGEALTRMLAKAGVRRITIASRATDYEMIRESVMAGLGIACCAKKERCIGCRSQTRGNSRLGRTCIDAAGSLERISNQAYFPQRPPAHSTDPRLLGINKEMKKRVRRTGRPDVDFPGPSIDTR